jgi:hypothetical protein
MLAAHGPPVCEGHRCGAWRLTSDESLMIKRSSARAWTSTSRLIGRPSRSLEAAQRTRNASEGSRGVPRLGVVYDSPHERWRDERRRTRAVSRPTSDPGRRAVSNGARVWHRFRPARTLAARSGRALLLWQIRSGFFIVRTKGCPVLLSRSRAPGRGPNGVVSFASWFAQWVGGRPDRGVS